MQQEQATKADEWWTDPLTCRGGSGGGFGQAIYAGRETLHTEEIAIVRPPKLIYRAGGNTPNEVATESVWRSRADIMAAAPEMYAALTAIEGLGVVPSTQPEYRMLADAIRKARGATS